MTFIQIAQLKPPAWLFGMLSKPTLSEKIISHDVNMKKRAHKEQLDLVNQIKEIDQQYTQVINPEVYKKQREFQTKFNLLLTQSIERQLLKSKSSFYTYSDKSGKMLTN